MAIHIPRLQRYANCVLIHCLAQVSFAYTHALERIVFQKMIISADLELPWYVYKHNVQLIIISLCYIRDITTTLKNVTRCDKKSSKISCYSIVSK